MRALLIFACLFSFLLKGHIPVDAQQAYADAYGRYIQGSQVSDTQNHSTLGHTDTLLEDIDGDLFEESPSNDDVALHDCSGSPAWVSEVPRLVASSRHEARGQGRSARSAFEMAAAARPIYLLNQVFRL